MQNPALTFDSLLIENTRRCNFACSHCCRGDAQNLDISPESINALLDQTEDIGLIGFIGGEPLLNLSAMDYVLTEMQRRYIPLNLFTITTNGYIFSNDFIDLIKRYANHIRVCNDALPVGSVTVNISMDRYHTNCEKVQRNYEQYKQALSGVATVQIYKLGDLPFKFGRAEQLDEAISYPGLIDVYASKRLEVFSSDIKPDAKCRGFYRLSYPEQIIICCPTYVTVNGDLVHGNIGQRASYKDIDNNTICNVTDNIWKSIQDYNRSRLSCAICTEAEDAICKQAIKDIDLDYLIQHADAKMPEDIANVGKHLAKYPFGRKFLKAIIYG